MTTKLTFDTHRYCTHNAGRMGTWQGKDVAGLIAEEVRRLRMANDLHEQGAEHMRDELAALKEAVRPVMDGVRLAKLRRRDEVLYPVSIFDALAALVGEE